MRQSLMVLVLLGISGCCSPQGFTSAPQDFRCSVDDAGVFVVEASYYSGGGASGSCSTELDGGLNFTLTLVGSCSGISSNYPVMKESRFMCPLPVLTPGTYATNAYPPTTIVVPDDGGTPRCE